MDLVGGTIYEYLSLVSRYPELRTQVPVISLSSTVLSPSSPEHSYDAVSAFNNYDTRKLHLANNRPDTWGPLCWFVAVDRYPTHSADCPYT